MSEFEPTFRATTWSFPQRNRLVAGISHATLIIEAGEKSGTLITARLAVDYNRELLVVPGSIFSKNHLGIHQFLKLGATPITNPTDILDVLQIPIHTPPHVVTNTASPLPPLQATVLLLLNEPQHRDTLIRALGVPASEAASILMEMELRGHITQTNNIYRVGIV
jgi:DNA processing protein